MEQKQGVEEPDGDELLDRIDYFEYWLKEAEFHSTSLGWRVAHLGSVLETIKKVFGEEVLRKHSTKKERMPFTGDAKRHPVGRLLATPSPRSISELIELAVYLRQCPDIPGFTDVVTMLRNPPQYERSLVQLALGYRFARLGLAHVAFEPPADRGRKADLSFVHRATPYLIECYEPDESYSPLVNELVKYLPDRVADRAKELGRLVVARVELTSAGLAPSTRREIETDMWNAIGSLSPRGRTVLKRSTYELEIIDASGVAPTEVEALARSLASGGDWVLNPSLIYATDVKRFARGGTPEKQIRFSWTVVSVREKPSLRDAVKKLATAVAAKVSQVRRTADGALGVMLVRTGYARTVAMSRPDSRLIMGLFGSLVLGPHANLAGVFLVDRGVARDHRPFMFGAFLCSPNGELLEDVFRHLRSLEDRRDVVSDWD